MAGFYKLARNRAAAVVNWTNWHMNSYKNAVGQGSMSGATIPQGYQPEPKPGQHGQHGQELPPSTHRRRSAERFPQLPQRTDIPAGLVFSAACPSAAATPALPAWHADLQAIIDPRFGITDLACLARALARKLRLEDALHARMQSPAQATMELLRQWRSGEQQVELVKNAQPGASELDPAGLLHALCNCTCMQARRDVYNALSRTLNRFPPYDWQAGLRELLSPLSDATSWSRCFWTLADELKLTAALNARMSGSESSPMYMLRLWQRGEGPVLLVEKAEPGFYHLDLPGLLHALHECGQPHIPIEVREDACEAIRCLLDPVGPHGTREAQRPVQAAAAQAPDFPDEISSTGDNSSPAVDSGPQSWEEKKRILEMQIAQPFGSSHVKLFGPLMMHRIIMNMPHLQQAGDGGARTQLLRKTRSDPAFFALAAIYFEHMYPAVSKLETSFVESLDEQITSSDAGSLPEIATRDVLVLLEKALGGYLDGQLLDIGFDTRPANHRSDFGDASLQALERTLGHAYNFLESRLAQLPASEKHLIPAIRHDYKARIEAFATDRMQRWLATTPRDFKPGWIGSEQKQRFFYLRPYLDLIDRHKPGRPSRAQASRPSGDLSGVVTASHPMQQQLRRQQQEEARPRGLSRLLSRAAGFFTK